MKKKWLPKQISWFGRLTMIIALVSIFLCMASPNFADESPSLHSQGSSSFFGKYEVPKPTPTPDPKPEPGTLPNPSNQADTPKISNHDGAAKKFPKTGTIVRNLNFPGFLMIGMALLLFAYKKRTKKKEN
jgi:hypothetical protein